MLRKLKDRLTACMMAQKQHSHCLRIKCLTRFWVGETLEGWMPGPDPHALWIETDADQPTVSFQAYLSTGNNGNRWKRAVAMLRRLTRGDWKCRRCGEAIPDWRRVDAMYCRESCRKSAARWRRWKRSSC